MQAPVLAVEPAGLADVEVHDAEQVIPAGALEQIHDLRWRAGPGAIRGRTGACRRMRCRAGAATVTCGTRREPCCHAGASAGGVLCSQHQTACNTVSPVTDSVYEMTSYHHPVAI